MQVCALFEEQKECLYFVENELLAEIHREWSKSIRNERDTGDNLQNTRLKHYPLCFVKVTGMRDRISEIFRAVSA
jgi:hypothetical protein